MRVEGLHELPAPREQVWSMLMDPQVLTRCLPGCRRLYPRGQHRYSASIRMGLNSLRGDYTGSLRMENVVPQRSYALILEGRAAPGFVRGIANIRLTEKGEDTHLHYTGETTVGGPIAFFARRTLQGMANSLICEFFETFERELRASLDSRT